MFTQGHRARGKIELVQSLCCKAAWSSSYVCYGWLCKKDDCEKVLKVQPVCVIWAFALRVFSHYIKGNEIKKVEGGWGRGGGERKDMDLCTLILLFLLLNQYTGTEKKQIECVFIHSYFMPQKKVSRDSQEQLYSSACTIIGACTKLLSCSIVRNSYQPTEPV